VSEAENAWSAYEQADLLYAREEIEAALDRMAAAIGERLAGTDPLVLAVLTGGMIPAANLVLRLDFPLTLDYLHATRYRGATRGGELHWLARPRHAIRGRTVLVVDDILDEGLTLEAILAYCREAGARAVYSAVLVDKERPRQGLRHADFTGLTVPDRYVFGYGMDYHDYLRNLPGIYALKEEEKEPR